MAFEAEVEIEVMPSDDGKVVALVMRSDQIIEYSTFIAELECYLHEIAEAQALKEKLNSPDH